MDDSYLFAILSIFVSVMAIQITRHTLAMDLSQRGLLSRINIGFLWPSSAVVIALFGWSHALQVGTDDFGLGEYMIGVGYVVVVWLATRRPP